MTLGQTIGNSIGTAIDATISATERALKSREYKLAKARLSNREWRLDNLYWIKDKNGLERPFRRNQAQVIYSQSQWFRDTITKSRQMGFSTFIEIEVLDDCIFKRNMVAGIIDITLDDAVSKLEKIAYAYKRLPAEIRAEVRLETANTQELKWSNGSSVSVGTSYRGGTLGFLHVSEFGKISARKPDVATEIKLGAFPSVPKTGKIRVESTAEGRSGEFREMVLLAEKLQDEKQSLTPLDFKAHFYPWYVMPEYRLPTSQVFIPAEVHSYFDELKAKHGIVLDGDQKAWYVKTREQLGPDAIFREYPSTKMEPWFASNKGAYFKDQLTRARLASPPRVGRPVEYDPTRPVNTAWDLGVSSGRIIFHQSDGLRHRIIDYWESEDSGLAGSIRALKEKQAARGFIYGTHYGPHDLVNKDWSNMTAKNRKEVAAEFGVNFHVVPRVSFKADSIEAARRFLENCWIDSEHASKLVEHLDNYSREWLKATGMFGEKPAKNGADHAADALQQLAMALQPDKDEERQRRYPRQQKAGVTQWSA